MKKMRLIALLLALVTVLSLLTACGKKEEIIAEAPDIQMEIDRPEPEPVVEEPKILNPLTGEEVTEESARTVFYRNITVLHAVFFVFFHFFFFPFLL